MPSPTCRIVPSPAPLPRCALNGRCASHGSPSSAHDSIVHQNQRLHSRGWLHHSAAQAAVSSISPP
jgi:hypothetical protein